MRFFVLLFAACNFFLDHGRPEDVGIASGYGDLDVFDGGYGSRHRGAGIPGGVFWAWINSAHGYLGAKDAGRTTSCRD
jgi:hypothetical protein